MHVPSVASGCPAHAPRFANAAVGGEESLDLQVSIIVSNFAAFEPVSNVTAQVRRELVFSLKLY